MRNVDALRVVGDDAQRSRLLMRLLCVFLLLFLLDLHARQLRRALDQRREQIGVVIRDHALHHGGHAFQAGAGIDRRLGQRTHLAVEGWRSNCMKTRFQIST